MTGNLQDESARRNRWSMAIWGFAALMLMLPAVAMQFTADVDWSLGDFIVMGVMLCVACGIYEVLARLSSNTWYRAAAGIAIVAGFLTVWVNLAVGMLGSEDNPANALFAGVLLVAALGAVIARFRAQGLARAMYATALAQGAITLYALFGGYAEVVFHVGFFMLPWLLSAHLFAKAAQEQHVARSTG